MFFMSTIGIIGNIVGGIAMSIFLVSSFLKTKKQILSFQSVAHVLLAISEALMQTFSSIVQEAVSLIRNISVILGKNTKWLNIFLVSFGTIFGIVANIVWDGNSWIGYLPVFANLEYAIVVVSNTNSQKVLKISLGISSLLWAVFFLVSANYLAGCFNTATGSIALITGIVLTIKDLRNKNKTEEANKKDMSE